MQPQSPELVHRDLSPDRLAILGALIDEVWRKTQESHSEDEGDGPWGLGCRFYDRLRTRTRRLSVDLTWLRIVEKSMHFVFTIGAVPIRFYRGTSRRAKVGYLNRRTSELQQQQLAFPGTITKELSYVLRIAIEVRYDDARPRLVLVKQTLSTGRSEEIWEIPVPALPKSTTSPPQVPSFRKPPVPIAAPVVSPKAAPKKKRRSDNEGA